VSFKLKLLDFLSARMPNPISDFFPLGRQRTVALASSNEIATKKAVNFWIIVLNLTVFRKHIARQSSTIHRQQTTTIPQGNLPQ
jgi:hypothetical protein